MTSAGVKRALLMTIIAAAAMIGATMTGQLPVFLAYNASASAPEGYYLIGRAAAQLDDYVLFFPDERYARLAETRGYVPPDVPLIKRVTAISGSLVCRRGRRVLINGRVRARALSVDHNGRPLPRWQGCRVLGANEIFVLQPHPASFDSRYFGTVARTAIIGRARFLEFGSASEGNNSDNAIRFGSVGRPSMRGNSPPRRRLSIAAQRPKRVTSHDPR